MKLSERQKFEREQKNLRREKSATMKIQREMEIRWETGNCYSPGLFVLFFGVMRSEINNRQSGGRSVYNKGYKSR
jgi:hypothetical protein